MLKGGTSRALEWLGVGKFPVGTSLGVINARREDKGSSIHPSVGQWDNGEETRVSKQTAFGT